MSGACERGSVWSAACVPGSWTRERLAGVPAGPGAAVLWSVGGRAVHAAWSLDVRGLLTRALVEGPEEGSRAADLRGVVARAEVVPAGFGVEADLAWAGLARAHLGEAFEAAMDRRSCVFVHVDPSAAHPKWTKVGSGSLRGGGWGEGVLIGPARDKHAAGRLIEALDDLFDLCRFHHILVQEPGAKACAYKEMGRCPAPCDGSESMASYRARVARAARFAGGERGAVIAAREREMEEAAGAQDFERAARCKRFLEEAARVEGRGLEHVGLVGEGAWLIAGRDRREEGRARVLAVGDGVWRVVGTFGEGDAAEAARSAGEAVGEVRGAGVDADGLAVVADWLYGPAKRRPAAARVGDGGVGEDVVAGLIRGALRGGGGDGDEEAGSGRSLSVEEERADSSGEEDGAS